ncbi:MAG TPA: zinc-binding dehydrogenase [Chloroflexia bacterium]|nr:zinc-binding dehydrogenase [Chloroflexia bacterium]
MPLELIVESPRQIGYTEYAELEPVGNEVRVRTTVSGIKHGTELNMYRGTLPFAAEKWDPELRLFRPLREDEAVAPFYPHTLGSWAAGEVEAVGPDVKGLKPGDRVHGEWKHRETAIKPETGLYRVQDGVKAETMVFTDPARFALAATHDAAIKLGDRVAVFGLGAIGMLAAQMARLNGASFVCVVDPMPDRRALALELGADLALNPLEGDAGMAIKQATGGRGVDVAIEISGVYAALQQAMRAVHKEALVVTASYYGDQGGRLDLSREWHHNRITLRSSMPVWDCAHRCAPMWDMRRLESTAIGLLASGALQSAPLIGARVPFGRAAEAYALIDTATSGNIKVLLTYSQ